MKKINLILILFLSFQFLSAQERTITGIVTDSIGVIPGANVIVKGKRIYAQTDFYGRYSLKATPNDTLLFSFVSYKDKKVKASKTGINVTLQGGVKLKETVGPPYIPKSKMSSALQTTHVRNNAIAVRQPKIQFDALSYDLGEVEQHKPLKKEIKFINIGDKPLIIEQVQTADDSGVASRSTEPVMPGKSGSIFYQRDTSRVGRFIKTITVKTNDPLQPVIIIQLKGTVIAE